MGRHDLLLEVLAKVKQAQKVAKNLNGWSWLDFFSDSWLFGLVKRNKVTELNEALIELREALFELKRSYPDMMLGNPQGMSDTSSDLLWDVWFDNPFTDLRVHREIKAVRKQLDTLEIQIRQLL